MITTGLALVCRDTRLRLFTVRGHIHDALRTKGAATDPEATKLCAALVHVEKAIEILQLGCPHCSSEPEWVGRGRIEMPNNGPIVDCPVCNSPQQQTGEAQTSPARR